MKIRLPSPRSAARMLKKIEEQTAGQTPGSVVYLAIVAKLVRSPIPQLQTMFEHFGADFPRVVSANWTCLQDNTYTIPAEGLSVIPTGVWWWVRVTEYAKREPKGKEPYREFVLTILTGPWVGKTVTYRASPRSWSYELLVNAVVGARRDEFEHVPSKKLVGEIVRMTVKSGDVPRADKFKKAEAQDEDDES